MIKKIKKRAHLLSHIREYSHEHPFVKFLIFLFVFIIYVGFTIINFGFKEGILVGLLTWSFFVFCTPIASAGLLIDFPFRFLTGIKMIYSEMIVWFLALLLNIFAFSINPLIYHKTIILSLFRSIILNPIPFWAIILLSGTGTFFSIYFGDEILDNLLSGKKKRTKYKNHFNKQRILILLSTIVFAIILYSFLLNKLNINIPLF